MEKNFPDRLGTANSGNNSDEDSEGHNQEEARHNQEERHTGASKFMPLHCDPSSDYVAAYIQNIPNRYDAIVTMNILLGNLHLKNDPLFVRLVDEAVERDIELGVLTKAEEGYENYQTRQRAWDQALEASSHTVPYEPPPNGGRQFSRRNRNIRATFEYYDEHSRFYVPKLIRCKWSLWVNLNPVPCELLGRSVDPFVRRCVSFFTLARSKDGAKNLGFGFMCFRCRKVLNRFEELMGTSRFAPWSAKKLKIGLAYQRDLPAFEQHFGQSNTETGSVFWMNRSLEELHDFALVSREYWALCNGGHNNTNTSTATVVGGVVGEKTTGGFVVGDSTTKNPQRAGSASSSDNNNFFQYANSLRGERQPYGKVGHKGTIGKESSTFKGLVEYTPPLFSGNNMNQSNERSSQRYNYGDEWKAERNAEWKAEWNAEWNAEWKAEWNAEWNEKRNAEWNEKRNAEWNRDDRYYYERNERYERHALNRTPGSTMSGTVDSRERHNNGREWHHGPAADRTLVDSRETTRETATRETATCEDRGGPPADRPADRPRALHGAAPPHDRGDDRRDPRPALVDDLLKVNLVQMIETCRDVLEIRLRTFSIAHAEDLLSSNLFIGYFDRLAHGVYAERLGKSAAHAEPLGKKGAERPKGAEQYSGEPLGERPLGEPSWGNDRNERAPRRKEENTETRPPRGNERPSRRTSDEERNLLRSPARDRRHHDYAPYDSWQNNYQDARYDHSDYNMGRGRDRQEFWSDRGQERQDRSDRGPERHDRSDRLERGPERQDRSDRLERGPERQDRSDRAQQRTTTTTEDGSDRAQITGERGQDRRPSQGEEFENVGPFVESMMQDPQRRDIMVELLYSVLNNDVPAGPAAPNSNGSRSSDLHSDQQSKQK